MTSPAPFSLRPRIVMLLARSLELEPRAHAHAHALELRRAGYVVTFARAEREDARASSFLAGFSAVARMHWLQRFSLVHCLGVETTPLGVALKLALRIPLVCEVSSAFATRSAPRARARRAWQRLLPTLADVLLDADAFDDSAHSPTSLARVYARLLEA